MLQRSEMPRQANCGGPVLAPLHARAGRYLFTAGIAGTSLAARYRAPHFNFYHGELQMKRLLFAVAVAIAAFSCATSLQAQTGGQATNGSTKAGTKSTGAPKQAKLPRCTRARQMAGTSCYGG